MHHTFSGMIELETHYLKGDGCFPNSDLPVLVYRQALRADAPVMERTFAENGWSNGWRNGIYTYHHFHSITHEVLGIAEGEVEVTFGGHEGHTILVRAGDVVVVPAGVAHCNARQSDDLLVVGAYPGGSDWDIRRGDPSEDASAKATAASVSPLVSDPLGQCGFLHDLWRAGVSG